MPSIVLTLKWQDEVGFEMTARRDAGAEHSVIRAEENGNMASMWTHLEGGCIAYAKQCLREIQSDMTK